MDYRERLSYVIDRECDLAENKVFIGPTKICSSMLAWKNRFATSEAEMFKKWEALDLDKMRRELGQRRQVDFEF